MKLVTTAMPDWPGTAASSSTSAAAASVQAGAAAGDANTPVGFGRAIRDVTSATTAAQPAIVTPAHPIPNSAPAVDVQGMFLTQAVQPASQNAGSTPTAPLTDLVVAAGRDADSPPAQPADPAAASAEPGIILPGSVAVAATLPLEPHAATPTSTSGRSLKAARAPLDAAADDAKPPVDALAPGLPVMIALPAVPVPVPLAGVAASPSLTTQTPAAGPAPVGTITTKLAAAVAAGPIETETLAAPVAPDGFAAVAAGTGATLQVIAAATTQAPGTSAGLAPGQRTSAPPRPLGNVGASAKAVSDTPEQAAPVSASRLASIHDPVGLTSATSKSEAPTDTATPSDAAVANTRPALPKTGEHKSDPVVADQAVLFGGPTPVQSPTTAGATAAATDAPAPATASTIPVPPPIVPQPAHDNAGSALTVAFAVAAPVTPVIGSAPAAVPSATIATSPTHLAHDVGLAIARQISAEGNALHIRLDPAELGRIDVRMSFDDRGNLRAVVAADSPVSLDLLRRDSGDLGRAMTDAGVRSDSQSFRFEGRGDGSGDSGRGGDGGQQRQPPSRFAAADDVPDAPDPTRFRPLHWRGQIDVIA